MENLRDKTTTDKEAYNSSGQVLTLSPDFLKSDVGDLLKDNYPGVSFVEKSGDTLVSSDDNTLVPTSSSTLIDVDGDSLDAGDTTKISTKRSHAASKEMKTSQVAGDLATTATTEPNTSEPVHKKPRKEVSKKPPSESPTKSNSSTWRRILRDYATVCDPKVFAQFLKECREKDSNGALLNECLRRLGFLVADGTLESFFKHQGFEDKVSERLMTDVIGMIFDRLPMNTLSKLVQLGMNILTKKVDDASKSENN